MDRGERDSDAALDETQPSGDHGPSTLTRTSGQVAIPELAIERGTAARNGFATNHMAAESADMRVVLADAHWARGTAEARRDAIAEATAALAELKAQAEPDAAKIAKAEAWLAHHH